MEPIKALEQMYLLTNNSIPSQNIIKSGDKVGKDFVRCEQTQQCYFLCILSLEFIQWCTLGENSDNKMTGNLKKNGSNIGNQRN